MNKIIVSLIISFGIMNSFISLPANAGVTNTPCHLTSSTIINEYIYCIWEDHKFRDGIYVGKLAKETNGFDN